MALFIGWIFLAFIIGSIGHSYNKGFWSGFLGSLFLSPLIGAIIVAASDKEKTKCKFCGNPKTIDVQFCPACDRDATGHDKEYYKTIDLTKQ